MYRHKVKHTYNICTHEPKTTEPLFSPICRFDAIDFFFAYPSLPLSIFFEKMKIDLDLYVIKNELLTSTIGNHDNTNFKKCVSSYQPV